MATIDVGFLVFPNVTQLDLMGPAQVLSRVPGAHSISYPADRSLHHLGHGDSALCHGRRLGQFARRRSSRAASSTSAVSLTRPSTRQFNSAHLAGFYRADERRWSSPRQVSEPLSFVSNEPSRHANWSGGVIKLQRDEFGYPSGGGRRRPSCDDRSIRGEG
jgi:hypothetical protein